MLEKKFWEKSYDDNVTHLNPEVWETSYVDAVRPAFENYPDKIALTYMGTEIYFKEIDLYTNRFADMLINPVKKR